MHKAVAKSPRSRHRAGIGDGAPEEIARTLKLDKGLGFLVRLLDTRSKTLYEQLAAQTGITPRQFGVLLTLHQQGTMTLSELARYIRIDRSTLGEIRSTLGEIMSRMEERSLVIRRTNGNDRRSAKVSLAPSGKNALFVLVSGVARLQGVLLAPLAIDDRAHFLRCMRLIAEPDVGRGQT
jgi:DNA-binding MarR family transcriptional regulator